MQRAQQAAQAAPSLEALQAAAQRFGAEAAQAADAAAPFWRGGPQPLVLAAGHWLLGEDGADWPGSRLFARMLASLRLAPEQLLTVNTAFWRAPRRTPPSAEISLSLPFVQRAIALARPRVLLLLGETGSQLLQTPAQPRARAQMQRYVQPDGAAVDAIVTLDPAYLLRRAKEKATAWADLQKLEQRLEELGLLAAPQA
jgi:DNA polymerase